jgi:hypothetical protein
MREELQMKRGLLSSLLQVLLLLFNLGMAIAVVALFMSTPEQNHGQLAASLTQLVQLVWMPGTVILGMLTLVTRENRIVMVKKEDYP